MWDEIWFRHLIRAFAAFVGLVAAMVVFALLLVFGAATHNSGLMITLVAFHVVIFAFAWKLTE